MIFLKLTSEMSFVLMVIQIDCLFHHLMVLLMLLYYLQMKMRIVDEILSEEEQVDFLIVLYLLMVTWIDYPYKYRPNC